MRLIALFLFIPFLLCSQTTRYASVSGSGTQDGTSAANSWTLATAWSNQASWDILYVAAGNYLGVNLTTTVAGTVGTPKKVIGYTATAGDITASEGPSWGWSDFVANSYTLPTNIMPVFDANAGLNPTSSEIGITINHDYWEFHNIMLKGYWGGIDVNGDNGILDNIIGFEFGNWDPNSNCWNQGSAFNCDNATGYGIYSRQGTLTSGWTVKNSMIIDAGLAAFFPTDADSITIEWCEGYAYRAGNGSDYIFDLFAVTNSSVLNCYAERMYDLPLTAHRSRSLILQAVSDNNVVSNFSSKKLRMQLENARSNTLTNLFLEGDITGATGTINSGGIQLMGQSNDNVFKDVYMTGEGIQMLGIGGYLVERERTPNVSAGDNNYFINVIMEDVPGLTGNAIFSFHRELNFLTGAPTGTAGITGGTNYVINGTFNNVGRIVNANRPGTVYFYNCSFNNVTVAEDGFYVTWPDYTNSYTAYYTNCHFNTSNLDGAGGTVPSPPAGVVVNPVFGDPGFVVGDGEDYTITQGSILRDAGIDASTINANANSDYVGSARVGNDDIGAFEWGGSGAPIANEIVRALQALLISN